MRNSSHCNPSYVSRGHSHRWSQRRRFAAYQAWKVCEPLEARRLLATVAVDGTTGVDAISVDWVPGFLLARVNGSTTWFDDANVDRLEIRALGGADRIDIERTGDNRIWINAGGGDDVVHFTPGQGNLGTLDADVTVRGDAGIDRIIFDDSGVPAGGDGLSYDLANGVFTRAPFSNPITFSEFEAIEIAAGGRDDSISVSNRDVETRVWGGGGDDTLILGSVTGDLNVDNDALVTFDGGAGIDEVRINDWANTSPNTYVIDTVSLIPGLIFVGRAGGFGGLDTFENELFLLEAGGGDDRIELNSVLGPGTSVRVEGNGGSDRLVVAGRTGKLVDVPAIVNFDGGSGGELNVVELVDLGNSNPTTYTITSGSATFPGFGHLNYSDTRLLLRAGPGDSTVNLDSSDALITINGGGGNDHVHIGGAANRVSDVQGPVTVSGGAGDDRVTFYDRAATQPSSPQITHTTIYPSGAGPLSYDTVERITFDTSDAGSESRLNSTCAETPIVINGGAGQDRISMLEFARDLARFGGAIEFNAGPGADSVTLSDVLSTESDDYVFDGNALAHPGFGGFTHTGLEDFFFQGSIGNNTIAIDSFTGVGTAFRIDGWQGDDRFHIAATSRDLSSIGAFVLATGGLGNDSIVFFDDQSSASETTTITTNRVAHPSFGQFNHQMFESMLFEGGSGDDDIRIESGPAGMMITARGNGGDDVFRVGSATSTSGLADLPARVHVEGGGGTNSAHLLDTMTDDNDGFTVTATQINHPNFGGLVYSDLGALFVEGGSGNNAFTVNSTSAVTDIRLKGNGGNDFFEVNATNPNRPVIIDPGAGAANVVNSIPASSAGLVLVGTPALQSLTLIGNARAAYAGVGTALRTQFLTVISGAQFDVGRGGVIVDYTGAGSPLQTHRAQIASGYAGGTWSGVGITSAAAASDPALAVGYAEASEVLGAAGGSFMGQTVDGTAVLIRQTRYGDANLDGSVNLADFNRIAANFGATAALWSQGNFNYDDLVNLADFNGLAGNFGSTA